MIAEFLETWPLFRWTYLAAAALSVALSVLGVVVVTRGQVFIAAATAFSGAAALATARRRYEGAGLGSQEATGWVFLACGSLAILVLAKQPVGLKEVQAMMASSVIGATPREAATFGVLAFAMLAVPVIAGPRLALLITDPTMASAVGLRVGAWVAGLAVVLGLTTGLAVQATGLLFAFGCLVLPALVAKNLCRDVAPMFWVAPAVGVVSVFAGFLIAHRFDFPPGQVVVALLAAVLLGAWTWREAREWFWG